MTEILRGSAVSLLGVIALGALVGWDGASRAVAVGPITLVQDHSAALAAAGLLVGASAGLASLRFRRWSSVAYFAAGGAIVYATLGVVLTLAIPELGTPFIPTAIASVTGLGTQSLALVVGTVLGRLIAARQAHLDLPLA